MANGRLEDIFVSMGLATQEQVDTCRKKVAGTGKAVHTCLIETASISPDKLAKAYAQYASLEYIDQIVEKFKAQHVSYVYTDALAFGDFGVVLHEYLPTFHAKTIFSQSIIFNASCSVRANLLSPMAILGQKQAVGPLDNSLEILHFWQLTRQIATSHLLTHIAEPLFYRRYPQQDDALKKELQRINGQ